MADEGLLTVILAGSEGKIKKTLRASSSYSRLSVYNIIPDIPSNAAREYLRCRQPKVPEETVDTIVETVGGRLLHLVFSASHLAKNKTVVEIQQLLCDQVTGSLKDLKIKVPPSMGSSMLSNATWAVALAILASKDEYIAFNQYRALMVHTDEEDH